MWVWNSTALWIRGEHLGYSELLLILAGAALLTWREWVEHHPPEIVIVAFLHFLFVFLVVAFTVLAMERWGRRVKKSNS